MSVRPAKTQINLGIRPAWSESSLCAPWAAKYRRFLHADSDDSDQTGRMPRLIWVFAERTLTSLVLSCRGLRMVCKCKWESVCTILPHFQPSQLELLASFCVSWIPVCWLVWYLRVLKVWPFCNRTYQWKNLKSSKISFHKSKMLLKNYGHFVPRSFRAHVVSYRYR